MNSKITTNSHQPKTESNKPKPNNQAEQEQNHRNGHHVEGDQWGEGEWSKGYRE